MKLYRVIIVKRLHVTGMALLPFILLKHERYRSNPVVMNHERIHLRQQAELLWLPFMLWYLSHYAINRLRGQGHDTAYRNIVFEREAYALESDLHYLKHRSPFAFLKFIRQRPTS